ncbi:universal stress protein [Methanobacterium paludis]|uniref:UspA domain-containing protein n=1 Tax=Methanobacterium paludis (strain DSM 25820 / JCM 18151 / SWAN1) TaxID=868131 RepID=F6D5S3_METPW|nr:universal stress protein [Methanobacterium paludis]AEG18255.1 UspA domain-containing protein [Methanobacterium paludis]
MFKNIMVPTDGSEFASKAEDVAIEMAKKFDSKVVAVHIIDDKLIYPFEVLEEEGKSILKKVQEKGEKNSVKVDEVLLVGNPTRDMKKIAEKVGADIIVIGTHGKTGLEKLIMGSVAESTLKTVKVPVLLLKKS